MAGIHQNYDRRNRLITLLAAAGVSPKAIALEVGLTASMVRRICAQYDVPRLSASELAAEIVAARELAALTALIEAEHADGGE